MFSIQKFIENNNFRFDIAQKKKFSSDGAIDISA